MTRRDVIYLSPYPPETGGIADYGHAFKEAVEASGDYRFVVPGLMKGRVDTFRGYFQLKREVGKLVSNIGDCRLVHAEVGRFQQLGLHALRLIKQARPALKCILTAHDPDLLAAPLATPFSLGGRGMAYKLARVLDHGPTGRWLRAATLRPVGHAWVLTTSGQLALQRHGFGLCPIEVLPHLDLRRLARPDPQRSKSRDTLTVLFLGFWGPNKGIETLLSAVAFARAKVPTQFRMLLAGQPMAGAEGDRYARALRQRIFELGISDLVCERGYVPEGEIDQVFDEADIMVLPYNASRPGSASGVAIRAMSAGLAIIASDVGAMRDELGSEGRGILVEPGNVENLGAALVALLGNADRRCEMAAAAQGHILAEHAPNRVADRVVASYDCIMAGTGTARLIGSASCR
jgi:glycosyltransferase involved in cell wall biosynthesis